MRSSGGSSRSVTTATSGPGSPAAAQRFTTRIAAPVSPAAALDRGVGVGVATARLAGADAPPGAGLAPAGEPPGPLEQAPSEMVRARAMALRAEGARTSDSNAPGPRQNRRRGEPNRPGRSGVSIEN